MPAGNYGGLLLQVADRLCAELGPIETGQIPSARSVLGVRGVMGGMLGPEDEALVRGVRERLARIARALGFSGEGPRAEVVIAALDGAEMALRGELVRGNTEQLPRLMPSWVFLVALAIVEQDRALEVSARTKELIAQAIETR